MLRFVDIFETINGCPILDFTTNAAPRWKHRSQEKPSESDLGSESLFVGAAMEDVTVTPRRS
jgi:hypothetical protein